MHTHGEDVAHALYSFAEALRKELYDISLLTWKVPLKHLNLWFVG